MAQTRTLQSSFNGGEVTPEFFAQIADAKFKSGAKTLRNFIALPHGPAQNRPGTQFVHEVKDSSKRTRIIPFSFSETQTMAVEIAAGFFRFHTNGATLESSPGVPYEIANPYAEADLMDIHYVQSADVMTLVHPNYNPRELRRLGATSWTLSTIVFAPRVTPPIRVIPPGVVGTTYEYKVTALIPVTDTAGVTTITESLPTALASITAEESSATPNKMADGVHTNLSCTSYAGASAYRWYRNRGGGTFWLIGQTDKPLFRDSRATIESTTVSAPAASAYAAPAGFAAAYVNLAALESQLNGTATGAGATVYSYVVTSVYGSEESGRSNIKQITNNLLTTGQYNTLVWPFMAGATSYRVYKESSGLYGFIGETDYIAFKDDNIAPDLSRTPPAHEDPFDQAGNFPAGVCYFEQRRCFAGTDNKPQNLWMTKTGTESVMASSLPVRDDDRISVKLAARQADAIRHLVPLSDLIALTNAAEWRVTSVNQDAITPTSISIKTQSFVGASNVQPAVVNDSMIYAASRGGHVREFGFSWQQNGYRTGDLSLRAPHLFDGLTIVDMAYSKAPTPIVWFVSSIGRLLGLTYVPEQQVGAWHWHDTDGLFESCCVVTEGEEDVLYVVVKRTIGGATKRYVERLHSRAFTALEDAFFVDSGLTYDGAPATTISGLGHLEGKTVAILGDGAVRPQRTVSGGAITLDQPASVAHVGLPITADLETLPIAVQIDNAWGTSRVKNVNRAWVRVYRSSGLFVGPSADRLTEAKQRTTEAYSLPPALRSELIEVVVKPNWQEDGAVFVRQANPLPLTVTGLSVEVEIGG